MLFPLKKLLKKIRSVVKYVCRCATKHTSTYTNMWSIASNIVISILRSNIFHETEKYIFKYGRNILAKNGIHAKLVSEILYLMKT